MSAPAADQPGLPPLKSAHATSAMGAYLAETWDRREYVWFEAISELRTRQITTVLGNLWHLLNPAINVAIYYLIFGTLLAVDRGVDNFILFLSVGLFVYQVTQKTVTNGARSIVRNRGLIQAIRFPRLLLPLTNSVTELLAALPTFLVLFVVAIMTGESVRWAWFCIVPLLLLQFLFNFGAALIVARMTSVFHDVEQLLPYVFRLLFYASGIIFSVAAFVESGSWVRWLFTLNPLYCFITIGRWSVMGDPVSGGVVLSAVVWSIVVFVAGFLFFRAGEEGYSRA